MNPLEVDNWGAYEDYVTQMFADRVTAEDAIEVSLRESDLHGAAMASLQVAMASLALGDRVQFQGYVLQATLLAEAEIIFETDAALQEIEELSLQQPPKPLEVTIPQFLQDCPTAQGYIQELEESGGPVYGWKLAAIQQEGLKAKARQSVEAANETLQVADCIDDYEKNIKLRDAVHHVCDLAQREDMASNMHATRLGLLRVAGEIASRIDLNGDIDDLEPAVDAYAVLGASAMVMTGKTLPILHNAAKSLQHLSERFQAESALTTNERNLASECRQYLTLIRRAQAQIIARSVYLPAKWIANDYYLTGAAAPTKGARTRPNRKTQNAAASILSNQPAVSR
jgi:hypothetical protein